jgi:cytochrome P450
MLKEVEQAPSPLDDPSMLENPYPLYQQIRSTDPVHWWDALKVWVLTRYADVVTALHDPLMSTERILPELEALPLAQREAQRPQYESLARQMAFVDPPEHTRLRSLVNKAFTPRAVEALRPRVQSIVDDLLDAVQEQGEMDVIRDLAYPLPTTVIASMFGCPPEDHLRLKKWSNDFAQLFDVRELTPEESAERMRNLDEFTDYFRYHASERRKNPKDDIMSALVAAEEQGEKLNAEELYANCVLIVFAGHETTTNLIGNGLLALLRHPDQMQMLKDDPSLIPGAVEEMLRYDSPVQFAGRMAKEDMELGGKRILKGQNVLQVLGSANRDPDRFPEPDRFDITRRDNRHVAFGYSAHFCLGAPLARQEGQIAFTTMLRRMPNLRLLDENPPRRENLSLRGLKSLPVAFES